jgi:REP element-mobilizing transposase RayT
MRQQTLFKHESTSFGGDLLFQKRKSKRPFSPKVPLHIVLRADITQTGSLLKFRKIIDDELFRWSEKFLVKLTKFALCSNHIHINASFQTIESYKKFTRTLSGQLAKKLKLKWEKRPYTRIVKSGRPEEILNRYIQQNHEEALGLRPYTTRKRPLLKHLSLVE